MLIPPQIFNLHKLCDTSSSRYALGGVRFERPESVDNDGKPADPVAVVTDGRVLLVVTWSEDNADEYPAKPVGLDATPVAGFATVVPADACQKAIKLPPKKTAKPILANVLLDETADNGVVPMGATDLEGAQQLRPSKLDGKYPHWRDVYPQPPVDADNSVSIKLDAVLLRDLLDTMIKAGLSGPGDVPKVVLTLRLDPVDPYNDDPPPLAARARSNAVRVTGAGTRGRRLAGIIMPRDEDDPGVRSSKALLPVWVPEGSPSEDAPPNS